MIYIVLYRRKHPVTDKLIVFAHPITFDNVEDADKTAQDVAAQYKCPAWLMECPEPEFRAPLKLVDK